MSPSGMLIGTCHCAAIRIEVPGRPAWLIDCNCSICRRNGALWALYEAAEVRIAARPGSISEYIWGPRTIRTMNCTLCGIVTHWEPLQTGSSGKRGVNMRNFDAQVLEAVRTRRFDGAETWSYLNCE